MATRTKILHADLCAGVGGFSLALRLVYGERCRTCVFVEREAYAVSTLMARMEDQTLCDAPVWDDIESFDGKPWRGKVDIVTAGFPCPPFSVAGKRKGTDDDRWLWPDIARILREMGAGTINGPAVVWMENVPGLALSNECDGESGWYLPSGLWHVLGDLAGMGFDAEWGMLRAADVGASHRRRRIYIVAYARCFQGVSGYIETGRRRAEESQYQEDDRPRDSGDELGHSASNDQRRHTNRAHRSRIETGGSSGRVAEPVSKEPDQSQSRGQSELRQSPARKRRRRHLDGSDQDVGQPESTGTRRLPKGSRSSGNGKEHSERTGAGLDQPNGAGRSSNGRQSTITGGNRTDDGLPVAGSTAMTIAAGERCEEPRSLGGDGGKEFTSAERSGLPLFPPGPGLFMPGVIDDILELYATNPEGAWRSYQSELRNTVDWYGILEVDQTLEPAIRRMADELSEGMDKLLWSARVDRIRAMGNAIVPTAAALAYIVLADRLGVDL